MIQEYIENITVSGLKNLVSKYSANKIFLVTGKKSYVTSGAQKFIETSLKGVDFVRFFEFEQNPKYEDSLIGVELYQQTSCDMILAIGGGSVIDMAKLINVFSSNTHLKGLDIINNTKLITNKGVPLIAIPTTAGTGSEATHFAVVYHDKKKYSLAHDNVLPDVACLNADFSFSQSKYLTACAGLDAFSQAVESYWSVGANDISKGFAKESIELLIQNLKKCVTQPDKESRKAIMKASYLAGKAINISKTTGAHAVSYAFTTYFSIPHGHAVFLTLPEFFEYNNDVTDLDLNDSRGLSYVKQNMKELCELFRVDIGIEAKLFLRKFAKELGIELSFEKLKIHDYENIIISNVNLERLGNNPRKISQEELRNLLKRKN
ncbi:phosphonoacetaldehyde reductase [Thalassobellus suaedae]|uniref:Phosphonoacetaldehyde reductase n=1 Tax=Thalassobellus suaedae TaxID=3074124 RepID=A0ABY9Y6S1_9FLAO|nr:phosphonoacetaldehyde reductase [Flavobacteriaceae bacterium HL-DH10]